MHHCIFVITSDLDIFRILNITCSLYVAAGVGKCTTPPKALQRVIHEEVKKSGSCRWGRCSQQCRAISRDKGPAAGRPIHHRTTDIHVCPKIENWAGLRETVLAGASFTQLAACAPPAEPPTLSTLEVGAVLPRRLRLGLYVRIRHAAAFPGPSRGPTWPMVSGLRNKNCFLSCHSPALSHISAGPQTWQGEARLL